MPWEKGFRKINVSDEVRAAVAEARKGGMSYRDIGKTFRLTNYTVHQVLTKAGMVKSREFAQVRPVAQKPVPAHARQADLLPGGIPAWMAEGLCAQFGPNWFFPDEEDDGRGKRSMSYEKGIEICSECPVREQCLQYALDIREEHGLWGGVTPRARRDMLSALRDEEVA